MSKQHEGFKSNKSVGDYVKKVDEKVEAEAAPPAIAPPTPAPKEEGAITQFVGTDEDLMVSGIIAGAGTVDEEEWEKTYLDIKSRGNYFDLIQNSYPFHLPKICQNKFEAQVARYGWIAKENMEAKCDPSSLFYWTPVNHNNHPELAKMMFNKHGGIIREGLYLCYRPWRMHTARQEMQNEMSRMKYEELDDMKSVDSEIGGHFDPTEGGRRGASRPGDVIVEEGVISHPDDAFSEAGDYE